MLSEEDLQNKHNCSTDTQDYRKVPILMLKKVFFGAEMGQKAEVGALYFYLLPWQKTEVLCSCFPVGHSLHLFFYDDHC